MQAPIFVGHRNVHFAGVDCCDEVSSLLIISHSRLHQEEGFLQEKCHLGCQCSCCQPPATGLTGATDSACSVKVTMPCGVPVMRDFGGPEIEVRSGNPSAHLLNRDCQTNRERKLLFVPDQCLKMKIDGTFVAK